MDPVLDQILTLLSIKKKKTHHVVYKPAFDSLIRDRIFTAMFVHDIHMKVSNISSAVTF